MKLIAGLNGTYLVITFVLRPEGYRCRLGAWLSSPTFILFTFIPWYFSHTSSNFPFLIARRLLQLKFSGHFSYLRVA